MSARFNRRLDRVVHERARLMILAYLASNAPASVSFRELKETLDLTAGNLSIQLRNLEEVEYVTITKSFKDNRPNTSVRITAKGQRALSAYLDEIEGLIQELKRNTGGRREYG